MSSSRREFLTTAGRVVVALPAGWAFAQVAGCGGGSSDNNNNNNNNETPPPSAPTGVCAGEGTVSATATEITSTSNCVQDHVHMVTLAMASVATPPTGGVGLDTTLANDHLHHVSLTVAQLQAINAGTTVTVTTSTAAGHSHTFAFHTAAEATPEPPAAPAPPAPPSTPAPPSGGY